MNTLFDSACGLNADSYAIGGTVLTDSMTHSITTTMTQDTGYFDLGKIVFTSGVNSGTARTVKSYIKGAPGSIRLISPLPNAPGVGDSFKLYPGCDKRQNTCSGKFANLLRFRGFPYIPENATAV